MRFGFGISLAGLSVKRRYMRGISFIGRDNGITKAGSRRWKLFPGQGLIPKTILPTGEVRGVFMELCDQGFSVLRDLISCVSSGGWPPWLIGT